MALTEDDFWALIALVDAEADDGTAAGVQAASRELSEALRRRSPEEVEAFMWGVTRRAGQLLRRVDAVLPAHLAIGGDAGRIQALSVVVSGERLYAAALADPEVVLATYVPVAEAVPDVCARVHEELTGVALDVPEGDEDPAQRPSLLDAEDGWIAVRPCHVQVPAPLGYWPLAERLTAALREDAAWRRWWAHTGAPPALVYVNFDTAESLQRWTPATIEGEARLGQVRVRRYRDRIEASTYSPSVGSRGSQAEVEQWVRRDLRAVFDALAVRLHTGVAPSLP
ncbi:DUF4240 domain-containing protein [Kineococcus sp. SYSU DK018]|uniref:hypothetical protein n=1 Tax=Kineococcus sp. SYSU DK018 TaxID=3383139 RepID=UPI003D7DC7FA